MAKTQMKVKDINETVSSYKHIKNKIKFLQDELFNVEKRKDYLEYEKQLAHDSMYRIARDAGKELMLSSFGATSDQIELDPATNFVVERDIDPEVLKKNTTNITKVDTIVYKSAKSNSCI